MNLSVHSSMANLSSVSIQLESMGYAIYIAADIINLILGLPTNAYVLWLIATGPRGTASDIFALNLAVTEMLSSLSSLIFIFYQQRSSALTDFAQYFKGLVLYGRPLFQGCVCVERYLAVIHPVTFLKYKPLRYRMGCSGVVWLLVIGSCFGYMLIESTLAWRCYAFSYNLVLFAVMLFCCLAVLRALKRPGPGDGDREREGTNNKKLRAFRIILTIMVFAVLMYLPRVLLLLSCHFIDTVKYNFAMSFCFFNIILFGFIQPLLYFHKAGKLPCGYFYKN